VLNVKDTSHMFLKPNLNIPEVSNDPILIYDQDDNLIEKT
jgi:hypothetical protein